MELKIPDLDADKSEMAYNLGIPTVLIFKLPSTPASIIWLLVVWLGYGGGCWSDLRSDCLKGRTKGYVLVTGHKGWQRITVQV